MKKILIILFLLSTVILTGCERTDNTPTCSDTQTLVDGKCVENVICDPGYTLVNNECVEDEISCDPGYVVVDGECELEDTRTELERAFDNSIDMSNYQLDITITEGDTTVTMQLLFDGNISSMTNAGVTEYFENTDNVCKRYTIQLDQVVEETVDCISTEDTRFKFFHGFEIDWFTEEDGNYALSEYALLTNFFRNALPDAEVANFVLTIEDDYFDTFVFVVLSNGVVYNFTMEFSNIDQTVVELPE